MFTPNKTGNRLWEFCSETVVSANFVIPAPRWTKDKEGKRSWVLEFLDESLI